MGSTEYVDAQRRLLGLGPDGFMADISAKRFADIDAIRFDKVGNDMPVAVAAAKALSPTTEADKTLMVTGGFSLYVEGSMTKAIELNQILGSRYIITLRALNALGYQKSCASFRILHDHFQYLRDNILLIQLHCRLLLTAPLNLWIRWWRRIKN